MDKEDHRTIIASIDYEIKKLQCRFEEEKKAYELRDHFYPTGVVIRFFKMIKYEGDITIKAVFEGEVLSSGLCKSTFRDFYRVYCPALGETTTVYEENLRC